MVAVAALGVLVALMDVVNLLSRRWFLLVSLADLNNWSVLAHFDCSDMVCRFALFQLCIVDCLESHDSVFDFLFLSFSLVSLLDCRSVVLSTISISFHNDISHFKFALSSCLIDRPNVRLL